MKKKEMKPVVWFSLGVITLLLGIIDKNYLANVHLEDLFFGSCWVFFLWSVIDGKKKKISSRLMKTFQISVLALVLAGLIVFYFGN